MTDEEKTLLQELYREVRWYRGKEYQTFLFSFPVIGVGFNTEFNSKILCVTLVLFASLMLFYIWANQSRMAKIKNSIAILQTSIGIKLIANTISLDIDGWAYKPWYKNLGTVTYTIILAMESLALIMHTYKVL
ncbi:MAG: hypothetical protein V1782_05145 [Pseudomonadota bacterium]